jgi:NDP-sugar pyrophosphorylase family protein
MILAAGLGTRLRPLTENRPKALVEVGGRTLLEITLARLRSFGITDVIVNTHHFADMVREYLKKNKNFGMNVAISHEEILLDTGGGLKNAGYFFLEESANSEEPFLLHNVDVISTIDFRQMLQFHTEHRALATLAVQERKTSRYLLFQQDSELRGRRSGPDSTVELVRPSQNVQALAFCGIHIISPRFLSMMTEEGAFSIISSYLRLAAQGQKIFGFRADKYYWRDLGTPENMAQAEQDFQQRINIP